MKTVSIAEAESGLSKLIADAEAGEEVLIARNGETVAKIIPFKAVREENRPKREFGALKGLVTVGPEFFEPLPEEELAAWEGAHDDARQSTPK